MNDKENITARQLALAVLNEFSIDRHDAGTLLHNPEIRKAYLGEA